MSWKYKETRALISVITSWVALHLIHRSAVLFGGGREVCWWPTTKKCDLCMFGRVTVKNQFQNPFFLYVIILSQMTSIMEKINISYSVNTQKIRKNGVKFMFQHDVFGHISFMQLISYFRQFAGKISLWFLSHLLMRVYKKIIWCNFGDAFNFF